MARLTLINRQKLFDASSIPFDWADSYTQCPTVMEVDGVLRVYFNTRYPQLNTDQHTSVITYVDLTLEYPHKIIQFSAKPILTGGGPGAFDHFGVGISSVLKHHDRTFLYYSGWQRQLDVPYTQSIGLAISNDKEDEFKRHSIGPIISVDDNDPFFVTTPSVLKVDGKFVAVYMSATCWLEDKGKMESIYTLKLATSEDGISWKKDNIKLLPDRYENECLAVPSLFFHDGSYHLLFSHRPGLDFRENKNNGYRIGYASSKDLINWTRDDDFIDAQLSDDGWDSEMVCYPHVYRHGKKLYMFYCGNYFGRDGIGMGELVFK